MRPDGAGQRGYPDISLAVARDLARRTREQLAMGIDPVAERQQRSAEEQRRRNAMTFASAAERWHAVRAREYRNQKHATQVLSTLRTYANPVIGNKLVRAIELSDVLAVLEPIWSTKTETADRLRGRIENVLSWATAAGHRSGDNPARWRGNLDALLPKPGKISVVSHHAALPYETLPDFYSRLRKVEGVGARALEFLILTAARSGEVRLARWDEIDADREVWTVPGQRMKGGREHRVPLSRPALDLLESQPRFVGSPVVFAAPRGGPLSDMTLSAVTRRMQAKAVPHGFRFSFWDWAAERTSYPSELAEMALAHVIRNKVEAAYRRGDLFEKRRQLMDDWASFVVSAIDVP
jgi:integrase